VILIYRIF